MAITINSSPQKYSPSNNPNIWTISSNSSSIVYFLVDVKDTVTSNIITTLKFYPSPVTPLSSSFNLQTVLKNLVNAQLVNDNVVVQPITTGIKSYRLKITEKLLVNGSIYDGTVLENTSDAYYYWDAELPDAYFNYYNSNEFVVTSGRTNNFLTSKPNNSYVHFWSTEYLYFINQVGTGLNKVVIKTYNAAGLKATYNSVITFGSNIMFRINVSPKSLQFSLTIDYTGVNYYTVELQTSTGTVLSSVRTFKCIDVKCHKEPVNILWENEYGGYDSFSGFINPQETINVTQTSISKYNYGVNASGVYSNINGGIRNAEDVTINSTSISTYNLTSEAIDDVEFSWLTNLLKSKQVYVELSDSTMLPIQLDTKSMLVQRRKYSDKLMRFNISYKATSGLNASTGTLSRFNNNVSQIGIIYNVPVVNPASMFSTVIGDGVTKLFTITHNLNTPNLNTQVLENSTGNVIFSDITVTGNNIITLEFGLAPTTNQIKVNIQKMQ